VFIGGVHALAVALTEDLVDPHDTIMGVVKLGYGTLQPMAFVTS
jgi:cystathionine beta-lyase family protein involved in aluminum resistance